MDAPSALGRGAVVLPGQAAPPALSNALRVRVDGTTLRADHPALRSLHQAWANRTPVVVELGIDPAELTVDEHTDQPPWELGLDFLFPRERLRFLVWANNADYRFASAHQPGGRWWHGVKATQQPGVTLAAPSEAGDIRLPDGRLAWVDGGPRDACPVPGLVVHREDIDLGIIQPVGIPADPSLLAALTPDQQGAVAAGHGAVRVPAPAGSGKTRVLAARLATLLGARSCPAPGVLALVYNTRAAVELRERVGIPGVTINTVHAHAYGLLRQHIPGIRVLEEREVRQSVSSLVDPPRKANSDPIGSWIDAFDTVRATLQNPVDAANSIGADLPGFAEHFAAYRQRLRESRVVDFAEMVPWAIDLLLTNPQIRHDAQRSAQQVLVDEFQDLTPAYLFYIRLLASPQLGVFGVGDDDQVIYGHAGASPSFLINFDRYFPGSTSHTLQINHRCPADVITKTNTLLAHNRERISKTIQPADGASATPVRIHEVRAEDGADKAAAIIKGLMAKDVPLNDIAVLARVHVALLPVQAALTKAGIASAAATNPGLLDRSAVRACLAYLRIASETSMAGSDLADVLHRPLRAIPGQVKATLQGRRWTIDELQHIPLDLTSFQQQAWNAFVQDLRQLRRHATHQPTAELLARILVDIDLGQVAKDLEDSRQLPGASTHTDDLQALRLVGEYCPDPLAFEPFLRAVLDPPPPTGPSVTLSSIHKVKGLEWPYVIVIAANEGVLPHRMAQHPREIEEERRIFHVAITRAKAALDVICQRGATSRFVREMRGELARQPDRPSPVRGTIAGSRRPSKGMATVRAVCGLEVIVSGGLRGEIVEIRGDKIFVSTPSRAVLQISAGSMAKVDGRLVRLTLQ